MRWTFRCSCFFFFLKKQVEPALSKTRSELPLRMITARLQLCCLCVFRCRHYGLYEDVTRNIPAFLPLFSCSFDPWRKNNTKSHLALDLRFTSGTANACVPFELETELLRRVPVNIACLKVKVSLVERKRRYVGYQSSDSFFLKLYCHYTSAFQVTCTIS